MKVNHERWYYHADVAGVVVFQDAVQKFDKTTKFIPGFVSDMQAMIVGRRNHPCIVQFTVTNEDDSWQAFGQNSSMSIPQLLALARSWAPDHMIDLNSGSSDPWLKSPYAHLGDVVDYHVYPDPLSPGRDPNFTSTQYAMVGEFGGVGAFVPGKQWVDPSGPVIGCHSYDDAQTPVEEAQKYIKMAQMLAEASDHVSAAVYTQIVDVETECDGFLNYDRSSKFDEATTQAIREANQAIIQKHTL